MKKTIILFAGTSEGRMLAETLSKENIEVLACVATEYGKEIMGAMPNVLIYSGRMDEAEMISFINDKNPDAVVDATHPYANVVTENIKSACEKTCREYIRLLRPETDEELYKNAYICNDIDEACEHLNKGEGNILLTTGYKELPAFANGITDKSRIYARVLLQEGLLEGIQEMGLMKNQIICMQGPFSEEINIATMKQIGAKYLVTKESGQAGGFSEKISAANKAGAECIVIKRPVKETGFDLDEVVEMITGIECYQIDEEAQERDVTLLGIGMGSTGSMTVEGMRACLAADCIIGATRMLLTVKEVFAENKKACPDMVDMYKKDEIATFISENPQYKNIVVALSGDTGFYSGATGLLEVLADVNVQLMPGISSVVYFSAVLGETWQDKKLISLHGRHSNIIAEIERNESVFSLASGAASIRELAQHLVEYGLGQLQMTVATDLSYNSEHIESGMAEEFLNYEFDGICVVIVDNPHAVQHVVTPGIDDDEFIRGKTPMTKEEIRTISISKLALSKDSIIYDIGAGTGSVSIECARMAYQGKVYAIEQSEEALKLIDENKHKFRVSNLEIIPGMAPQAMEGLPRPTHAFIGGSKGHMSEIIHVLKGLNPNIRIVINCIALDTVAEVMNIINEGDYKDADIVCVNVSKSKTLGNYHMMMGVNPVYVITLN